MSLPRQPYAPGWDTQVMAMVSARTSADRAAFVLPLLRNGTRLLDVGCGPGTITVGLARSVGPDGVVVGVDMQPSQIDLAAELASSSEVPNARFQVARATELPFEGRPSTSSLRTASSST